jgi:hypothetical protein
MTKDSMNYFINSFLLKMVNNSKCIKKILFCVSSRIHFSFFLASRQKIFRVFPNEK